MQYLPGFTVQCINPQCEARGHWLRADFTVPLGSDGHCPCCGDFLRNVPPPLAHASACAPAPSPPARPSAPVPDSRSFRHPHCAIFLKTKKPEAIASGLSVQL